jgi:TolB-like protein/Flp pilus assembly protein TadD
MPDLIQQLSAALGDRYAVEREVGRGGMAVVYLAEDLKHHRKVAIKVLRPELAAAVGGERFLREIEAAARLAHPNILPLHDSGEADGLLYYVMPYVEGGSLRERLERERQLPIEDAAAITRDVAAALDHAHERGLVHRDIKPENILFRAGRPAVSDFGVARAVSEAGGKRLTETGLAVGTPAYMSPEQAAGEATVDGRADVYSLGCILYEMLAGSAPFTGATPQAVIARKAAEPVPSIRVVRDTVPEAVEEVVRKGLARAATDRYRTAGEMSAALEAAVGARAAPSEVGVPRPTTGTGVGPTARRGRGRGAMALVALLVILAALFIARLFTGVATASGIHSLAVLPLQNDTGDPEQDYFVEGMHTALIGELSEIDALRVISRRSVMKYEAGERPAAEVARELDVDGIVGGSVSRTGDSVQIQVRLIGARPEEREIWRRTYSANLEDVLSLHSDAAREIASEIQINLSSEEEARFEERRRVDPETYEAYLRGMYHLNRFTPSEVEAGLAYLREAVADDSTDATAWAGLALGLATVGHSPASPPQVWEQALTAAGKAVELDSMLAEGWAALADVKVYYEYDWEGAEQAFLRANELNPNLAMNHYHYAWFLELFGRPDAAIVEHRIAQQLDPLTPTITAWMGGMLSRAGRTEEAMAEVRKALELDANNAVAHLVLGGLHAANGDYEEAIAVHRKLVEINPLWTAVLGATYARAGRTAEAKAILAELEANQATSFDALGLARLNAALGNLDEAFRWLNYEPRHAFVPWIRSGRAWEPLHGDPRYAELLERMNLRPLP